MLARRPPSVLQQQRQQARAPCARALAAPLPRAPLPPRRQTPTLAASAAPRGDTPLTTATAATTTEEQPPSSPTPTPPSSPPSAAAWEDLYIIPSTFSDDDQGDDDDETTTDTTTTTTTTMTTTPVRAWPGAGPIVVLPGFGNDTQDYESPFGDPRRGLAPRLRRRGFVVETVRLRRRDWLRVAKAVASPAFWRGEADVGPGYRWYLLRVAAAVKRAEKAWVDKYGGGEGSSSTSPPPPRVTLVGHSAGGWLARAFVGDAALRSDAAAEAAQREEERALQALAEATSQEGKLREALATVREVFFSRSLALEAAGKTPVPCRERPHPAVGAVVTLGTPHTPPTGDKARDVTGGALAWVNEHWPGAFFGAGGRGGKRGGDEAAAPPVLYLTVAGRAVRAPPANAPVPRGSPPSYAREAYRTVAGDSVEEGGDGLTEGDAVVPLSVASGGLPGADARVVLDGVWHSMSRLGTLKEPPAPSPSSAGGGAEEASGGGAAGGGGVRPWYGSGGALDAWLAALREAEERAQGGERGSA